MAEMWTKEDVDEFVKEFIHKIKTVTMLYGKGIGEWLVGRFFTAMVEDYGMSPPSDELRQGLLQLINQVDENTPA